MDTPSYQKTLSSKRLRANYCAWAKSCDMFNSTREFQTFFKGYQAHHIIPREVAYVAFEMGLLTSQEELERFDDNWNCIMISAKKGAALKHLGSHAHYTQMILDQITENVNQDGLTFLQKCLYYVTAMHNQMEEVQKYGDETSVSVDGLATYLDNYYDYLKQNNLCDSASEDEESLKDPDWEEL